MSLYRIECVILVHGDNLDDAVEEFEHQLNLIDKHLNLLADIRIISAEEVEEAA